MEKIKVTKREQAVLESIEQVKKRLMAMMVYYKDVLEAHDIMSISTMVLVEAIEMYAECYHEDAKKLAQTACESINEVLEI